MKQIKVFKSYHYIVYRLLKQYGEVTILEKQGKLEKKRNESQNFIITIHKNLMDYDIIISQKNFKAVLRFVPNNTCIEKMQALADYIKYKSCLKKLSEVEFDFLKHTGKQATNLKALFEPLPQ